MTGTPPDPGWYVDHVLANAEPGRFEAVDVRPAARWRAWWVSRLDELDEAVAGVVRRQGFVATTQQCIALGMSANDIRREIRRGTWWTPVRGTASPVVIPEANPDNHAEVALTRRRRLAVQSAGAALVRPHHAVSGRSAAVMHGLPTVEIPHSPELTALSRGTCGRRGGRVVRGAELTRGDLASWFGVPVTSVSRTLVDLARLDRRDGLVAADAALRQHLVDLPHVEACLADARGWPGVRQARAVFELADPLAESPLESLVRLALHDDGFPPPRLQVGIDDPTRGKRYRVDFMWPGVGLVVEADGRLKYTAEELWQEKRRETRLHALGYQVERVLWDDVIYFWPETSRRLRAAYSACTASYPTV